MINGHKVWDCFTFAGYDPELEILEIRLHELEGLVDRIVLVEATRTHSGKPKDLNFRKHQDRFRNFLPKIEYVVVEDYPDADMTRLGESWKYERHQRDCISRGLNGAKDDDIVISSDLDEIPRASVLSEYRPEQGMVGLDLSLHTYWLNLVNRETEYAWCKVLPYVMAKNMTHCQIRYTFGHPIVKNGGWHFSYMGGPKEVVEKIESFAHQEYSIPRCKDHASILKRMEEGIDPHERSIRYKLEPLEAGVYPRYVTENKERFARFIKPVPGKEVVSANGVRSVDWNRKVWASYAWAKGGDEWTEMAAFSGVPYEDWKDSFARTFLYPYLVKAGAVLEIGAGHGRWSKEIERRLPRGAALHLIDVTPECVDFLLEAFKQNPYVSCHLNDGRTLPMLTEKTIDFIFSFDTLVHVEEPEFRSYAREFRRVMKHGSMGVIHHPGRPNSDQKAKGCRSGLTGDVVKRILIENGFFVIRQCDAWEGGNVKMAGDQITVFSKP